MVWGQICPQFYKKAGRKGCDLNYLLPVAAETPTKPELGCVGQVVQLLGGNYAGNFGITMKVGETAAKWQIELHDGNVVYVDVGHIHVVDITQGPQQENMGWETGQLANNLQVVVNPPNRPYYNNYCVELGHLAAWLDEYQNDPTTPVELVVVDKRKGVAAHQAGLSLLGDATNRQTQTRRQNTTVSCPLPSQGTSISGGASTSTQAGAAVAEVNVNSVATAAAADYDREWTLKFGCRRGHARCGREVSNMKSVDCKFSLVVKHAAGSQHVHVTERCWHTNHDVADPTQTNFLKPTEHGIKQCWWLLAAGCKPKQICDILNRQIEEQAAATGDGATCPNRVTNFIASFNDPRQRWTVGMVVAQQKAYKRTQVADFLPDTQQV
jgi:hypothetical protein